MCYIGCIVAAYMIFIFLSLARSTYKVIKITMTTLLTFSVRNARLIEDGQGSVIGKALVPKKVVGKILRK